MTIELTAGEALERARAGDGGVFRALTSPYRGELLLHCYRMLGSLQDAEDMVQETLFAAWRAVAGFEGRSSVRTWLHQIATNRCLNALRAGARRPRSTYQPEVALPPPTRYGDVTWLEPYPDVLLEGLPDETPGPAARYEAKEAVSLAFMAAAQVLPPRQRAVLVLRDVLGYPAAEVAAMLDGTVDSMNGLLKRARAAMAERMPTREATPGPSSAREREIVEAFTVAFERGDVPAVVALLSEDAWLTMPPLPLEYSGPAEITNFLTTIAFRDRRRYHLVPTRANGQPAFGCYLSTAGSPRPRAHGILVLTVAGGRVTALTRFIDTVTMAAFGLPRAYPERPAGPIGGRRG